MKKLNSILLALCFLGLFQACKERCYDCPSHRVCIDGECVLGDGCFELNNVGVCYDNLYLGVVKGNSCVDTIIFNGTNTGLSEKEFIYFVKSRPVGLEHRSLGVTKELGENEYIMGDILPVCGDWRGGPGVYWYFSNIRCKIYPDSVRMNIYFQASDRTLDDPFIDSCKVTLYKKALLPK